MKCEMKYLFTHEIPFTLNHAASVRKSTETAYTDLHSLEY
jgi:hypothetical protein